MRHREIWTLSLAILAMDVGPVVAGENEVLRVCTRPNIGFLEQIGGEPRGFEHDLLESFAQAAGVELEVTWASRFPELFTWLESGRCDLAAAAIANTAERRARIDFTRSYFPVMVVVIEAGNVYSGSLEALAGKVVAVVGGTLHEELLRQHPDVERLKVEGDPELFERVVSGDADALVCDSIVALPYLERYDLLHISFALSETLDLAFGLGKGSKWKRPFDQHLERLRASGAYRRLLEKHFGADFAAEIDG